MLLTLFLATASYAQVTSLLLEKYNNWPRYTQLQQFYQSTGNRFLWVGNPQLQQDLLGIIQQADYLGLEVKDYQFDFFKTYTPGQTLFTQTDSVETDLRFSDAALHFFSEVKNGNQSPPLRYDGLNYRPVTAVVTSELIRTLPSGNFKQLVADLQPKSKEYYTMLAKLHWFQHIIADNNFSEEKITSTVVDQNNKPLLKRLYQFGITDSLLTKVTVKELLPKVREAQKLFDLLSDGLLRSTARQAFNVPLKNRVVELKRSLNYLRWLEQIKQTGFVLILNQPSATLMVYENGGVVLDSKVIIGKPATPTPTLSSTITEVILYPYWMVPHSIATKELLPSIKRNIAYLDRNGYQVLNKQGKVVNPYTIKWSSLSTSYFPYIIRQSTGCDNALGLVKLNFYNPFTVYLHDTPSKSLFGLNKRYFSHGCMRVEKPVELARLVLG
ncbi:MAG TPA: L,D-transpeptidase family protein, partial [Chitinophagaceae bacterium]